MLLISIIITSINIVNFDRLGRRSLSCMLHLPNFDLFPSQLKTPSAVSSKAQYYRILLRTLKFIRNLLRLFFAPLRILVSVLLIILYCYN